jgi:hypothetical protein
MPKLWRRQVAGSVAALLLKLGEDGPQGHGLYLLLSGANRTEEDKSSEISL